MSALAQQNTTFAGVSTISISLIMKNNRKITEIIVHCTASRASGKIGASDIDIEHRRRGFRSIGYHYVVRTDGRIEPGRPETEVGAHCLGHNNHSIGVAYVGGLDRAGRPADTRTAEQRKSLELLLKELLRKYPHSSIFGHRDFARKDCPCFDATIEYKDLEP